MVNVDLAVDLAVVVAENAATTVVIGMIIGSNISRITLTCTIIPFVAVVVIFMMGRPMHRWKLKTPVLYLYWSNEVYP